MFLRTAESLVVEVEDSEPVAVSFEDATGSVWSEELDGDFEMVDDAMVLEAMESLSELLALYGTEVQ